MSSLKTESKYATDSFLSITKSLLASALSKEYVCEILELLFFGLCLLKLVILQPQNKKSISIILIIN